jgi:prepilin-type N-terminal cleavage/methylation domain-containing protein
MNKSFTLIEILVVIVVIGILSSFILVSMNSITTNADFTKRKAFSNSIRNALLINLVSEWKLNEGSGQIASDSWKENHGTLGSTSGIDVNDPTWKTSEECVSYDCLSFDGSFDYVNFGNGEGSSPSSITVEAWFKSSGTLFDWATIINKGVQADNNHFWLHYMSGTGLDLSMEMDPQEIEQYLIQQL